MAEPAVDLEGEEEMIEDTMDDGDEEQAANTSGKKQKVRRLPPATATDGRGVAAIRSPPPEWATPPRMRADATRFPRSPPRSSTQERSKP